jgi:transposase-like protein
MSKLKSLEELFGGRHFDREIIILCVRWYLRYKLSLRDLVEMMAERGLSLAHTTILRWVRRYTPEFVKRWNRFATPAEVFKVVVASTIGIQAAFGSWFRDCEIALLRSARSGFR